MYADLDHAILTPRFVPEYSTDRECWMVRDRDTQDEQPCLTRRIAVDVAARCEAKRLLLAKRKAARKVKVKSR